MQADNASTIDSIRKEKNLNEDGLDAQVRGPSPTGVKDIEDAVFGAIGEDGPNYRNVSRLGVAIPASRLTGASSWAGQAQVSSW